MIDVQMMLGTIRFSVLRAAYQELVRSVEHRWAGHEFLGEAPAYQYVGPGEETITLTGTVYPHIPTSWGSIAAMRDLAAKGLPQMLVSGIGDVLGRWVIVRVEEGQPSHFILGIPRKQTFSVTLRKHNSTVGLTALSGARL